jgi:hypothetical protein
LNKRGNALVDLGQELVAKTGLLFVVPASGVVDVLLGFLVESDSGADRPMSCCLG